MAGEKQAKSEKTSAVPYLPYSTFETVIKGLEQGIPHQIDRSLWTSQSGATQGQILSTLEFLGFIDSNGVPSQLLTDVVKNPDNRALHLEKVVKQSYPSLIEIGLERATVKQVEDEIRNASGLSGNTHRKAVAFFLRIAKEANIALSTHLSKKTRKRGGKSNGTTSRPRKRNQSTKQTKRASPQTGASGASVVVALTSGGELTLALSPDANLFTMDTETYQLMTDLKSRIAEYEKAINQVEAPEPNEQSFDDEEEK